MALPLLSRAPSLLLSLPFALLLLLLLLLLCGHQKLTAQPAQHGDAPQTGHTTHREREREKKEAK